MKKATIAFMLAFVLVSLAFGTDALFQQKVQIDDHSLNGAIRLPEDGGEILEETEPAMLGGKVEYEDGTPIPDVNLMIFTGLMVTDVTTDASGHYEMAFDAAPCTVLVFVDIDEIEDVTPPFYQEYFAAGDTNMSLDFTVALPPEVDAWFAGTVTDEEGDPAAMIDVRADSRYGESFYATTDASGNFVVGVFSEEPCFISLELEPGMISDPMSITATAASGETLGGNDFIIMAEDEADAYISGNMLDEAASPAPGYIVQAIPMGYPSTFSATTDAYGNYTIPVVGGHTYQISPLGFLETFMPPMYVEEVHSGDSLIGIDFTVMSGTSTDAVISGYVYMPDSTGADRVEISAYGSMSYVSTFTDTSGYYELEVSGGDSYEVSVSSSGSLFATPEYYYLDVLSGDTLTDNDFYLIDASETNAIVRGRVLYEDDTPAAFVTVDAWADMFWYDGMTDADGYYEIEVVGGTTYYIECWVEDYISDPEYYEEMVSVGDTLEDIDFVLYGPPEPNAYITGTVTLDDGHPIGDITITAEDYEFGFSYDAVTTSDGTYSIAVPGGLTFDVYPEAWDYISSPEFYYDVAPDSGETLVDYDFELTEMTHEEMSIIVNVFDSIFIGIPDIEVRVTGMDFDETMSTDSEGEVTFYPWEPGRYTVTPSHPTASFDPPNQTVEVMYEGPVYANFMMVDSIVIEPEYLIVIHTADSEGIGWSSMEIEYKPSSSSEWTSDYTLSGGWLTIPVDEPGNYDVRAVAPEGFYSMPSALIAALSTESPIDSLEFIIHADESVDESKLPGIYKIGVFPNPFNSACFIDIPDGYSADIFDITGNIVHSMTTKGLWTPEKSTPAGLYLVNIKDNLNNSKIQRIIYAK